MYTKKSTAHYSPEQASKMKEIAYGLTTMEEVKHEVRQSARQWNRKFSGVLAKIYELWRRAPELRLVPKGHTGGYRKRKYKKATPYATPMHVYGSGMQSQPTKHSSEIRFEEYRAVRFEKGGALIVVV
jgi:hypothetical protein